MAEPILTWAGGKRQMLDEITKRLPPKDVFNNYFEPFFGGGAVFFSLEPSNGYINDLNPQLMNFYRQVRDVPELLLSKNEKFDKDFNSCQSEEEKTDLYEDLRDEFNSIRDGEQHLDESDEIKEAALLLFLNRACWNGVYRTNTDGEFNVPLGDSITSLTVIRKRILRAHRVLQDTRIESKDFTYVRDHVGENDAVFFDPPYPAKSKTAKFESYTPEGFTEERQRELIDLAVELHERGAYITITNRFEAKDLYDDAVLPDDFRIIDHEGQRRINSDATGRSGIGKTEIIITNYSPFMIHRSFDSFRTSE